MIQHQFAERVAGIVGEDATVVGLTAAGSWLTNEMDEYSDLDLVLVTRNKVGGDRQRMMKYAEKFGKLLSAFTGEHVGEPRLLICLYDEPLLHVDIKFVTLEEFAFRVEEPAILYDAFGQLEQSLQVTEAQWPNPGYQWIEDRFWVWIHYGLTKVGRGEYFEAIDFLTSIRNMVLGPMLLISQGQLPRGVRKLEKYLPENTLEQLKGTLALHDRVSLLKALHKCVELYRDLRSNMYSSDIQMQHGTEKKVLEYYDEIAELPENIIN